MFFHEKKRVWTDILGSIQASDSMGTSWWAEDNTTEYQRSVFRRLANQEQVKTKQVKLYTNCRRTR